MELNKFAPIVELDYTNRADLAATVATPGYRVIHKLMRGEVDKFVLSLINTPLNEEDLKEVVVSRFLLAKAAAQFYQQTTDRINEETLQYVASQDSKEPPADSTAGILDIGEPDHGEGDSIIND